MNCVLRLFIVFRFSKLPEYYQNFVWDGKYLSVGHIRQLDDFFETGDVSPAIKWLDETVDHKWTVDELFQKSVLKLAYNLILMGNSVENLKTPRPILNLGELSI